MAARTDWFAVAKTLTDPRIGGADPQAEAATGSPDMRPELSRTASAPATHQARVSSAPPSSLPIWAIWTACAALCVGVWMLVVYAVLVLA